MKRKSVDILLPCFNEEKTISTCIKRIRKVMDKTIYNYHIIVCDNNSFDKSREMSLKEKAKVIIEINRGYGATLMNGINHSKSDYIVMLDSDLSYNEKDIPRFLDMLSEYDFVIGNRFKGFIEKDAMPFSHRYGSRILTEYGNILFRTKSHDYHCGLRAFKRDKIINCNLNSTGFEFASEMVVKAKLNNLKMIEISTDLFKDGRDMEDSDTGLSAVVVRFRIKSTGDKEITKLNNVQVKDLEYSNAFGNRTVDLLTDTVKQRGKKTPSTVINQIIENPTTGRSLLVLVILLVVSMASLIITKRYQKPQLSK